MEPCENIVEPDDLSTHGKAAPLHRGMSIKEFDNAYYYAAELKRFAREVGITVGNLRKVELEALIREFLQTGKVPDRKPVMPRKPGEARDVLKPDTVVTNYVGDKMTKAFLLDLVQAAAPGLGIKSGQWYWLNDWRRQQQEARLRFTYGHMADHLRSLMETEGRLPQIPSARMNNFITAFRADPANTGIPREAMMQAWMWLKAQPGPNTYAEFCRLESPTLAAKQLRYGNRTGIN